MLNWRKSLLAGVILYNGIVAAVPANAAETKSSMTAELKIEGAAVHPTVYLTPDDVKRARENVTRFPWAKEVRDSIVKDADSWLARSDDWYRSVLPKAGAAFAYGFTGCPICGAQWGTWENVNASFDKPFQVTCKNGHVLPDAEHPDPGTGYVAPDGRIHYMIGSYNAWVIENITFKSIENLVYAYTLTGEERYASKAAFLLDQLAAIYPECNKGSWDYPSNPPSGRFNRPWYQVARVLVHYVDQYDQIFNSKSLDQPSVVPNLTRRQNIEKNMLLNGAEYCYKQSLKGGLNNGEADYIRGALSVGVCLGIPQYVKWAVDGPFGIKTLLENNIDRDGGYYETSVMYSDHTRELYFTYAEPLLNYRGSAYPQGVDLYQHPKFRNFCLLHNLAQDCIGHLPRYGDSGADFTKAFMPTTPFNMNDYRFLERLYARAGAGKQGQAIRAEVAPLLNWLSGGNVEAQRAKLTPAEKKWLIFHASAVQPTKNKVPEALRRKVRGSDFLGQKGIAILRAEDDENAQAALLRFGPVLNHGHIDDLNLNYFGLGYELTYDLGYGLATTHTQVGWSRQTASHNLVVVDETTQGMQKDGKYDSTTGGSLHLFAEMPGARVVDASSNGSYKPLGVDLYRRTLILIGEGADKYLLDLFRVRGGRQHDYMLHAPTTEANFSGVTFGAPQKGSLAGPDIDWLSQQLNDGDMKGYPNKPSWNPPPGNGYGFLSGPQQVAATGQWSADWTIDETTHLRATMPETTDTTAITAVAPGIYPGAAYGASGRVPRARYVISRRKATSESPLQSTFVAALEPYNPKVSTAQTVSVERLDVKNVGDTAVHNAIEPVAVKITRRDGVVDYVYSAGDDVLREAGGFRVAGRFAHIRLRGNQVIALNLAGVSEFNGFGRQVRPQDARRTGNVVSVDAPAQSVTVDAVLPTDGTMTGQVIAFDNPRYTRNTVYRIAGVQRQGNSSLIRLATSPVLGKGEATQIPDKNTLLTSIQHEYANGVRRGGDNGFFTGKLIRTASGKTTNVKGVLFAAPMRVTVEDSAVANQGEVFYYEDILVGYCFEILGNYSLKGGK